MRPSIDLYPGVKVDKDTVLEFHSENVDQVIKNLKMHNITHVKGDGFEGTYDTIVDLNEGDILIFEEDGRGYIKPVESMVTIEEAIKDLENIRELG
jgi:hypothetical protein